MSAAIRLLVAQVAELQHLRAPLHNGHPGTECREHRRVLDADHTGPNHDHRAGYPLHPQQAIGVEHMAVVELDLGRSGGLGAGSDHDLLGGDGGVVAACVTLHGNRLRALEAGRAPEQVNMVAQQLAPDHLDLATHDMLGAGQQVGNCDLGLDPVAGAVNLPLGETGEVEDSFPQRLGWDRPAVDADPAHHVASLGQAHPLPSLAAAMAAFWPRAEHQQVVVVHTTVLPTTERSLTGSRRPPPPVQPRAPGSRRANRKVNSARRLLALVVAQPPRQRVQLGGQQRMFPINLIGALQRRSRSLNYES